MGFGKSTGLCIGIISLLISEAVFAQDPADFFRKNCVSCHTIGGGRLIGPDLKDVTQRQPDREWLVQFILDPQGIIDKGDPYIVKLKKAAGGAIMTKSTGINIDLAEALLDLIEAESKLEESQFIGLQISMEPFTEKDIALGRDYFTGDRRFENRAAPCFSCHAVRGTGVLGGGRLGPDLSLVYERLEGRKNLSAWLYAPATTTMQSLFQERSLKKEEIHALVAFLENSTLEGGEETMSGLLAFLLLGLGGAVVGLVLFDSIWKRRFRAVRSLLVRGLYRQGDKE